MTILAFLITTVCAFLLYLLLTTASGNLFLWSKEEVVIGAQQFQELSARDKLTLLIADNHPLLHEALPRALACLASRQWVQCQAIPLPEIVDAVK